MTVNRWPSLATGLLSAGLVTLAALAALSCAKVPGAAEPTPQQSTPGQTPAPPKKLTVEEYRRKYPFESLSERLAYEQKAAEELKKGGAAPPLSTDARKRLD